LIPGKKLMLTGPRGGKSRSGAVEMGKPVGRGFDLIADLLLRRESTRKKISNV